MQPQTRGDLANARLVEQIERRIAQQRHCRWSGAEMDETGVLAQGDVFLAMDRMFDGPMATAQCQQSCGIGLGWCETGNPVVDRVVPLAVLVPGAFQPEDLRRTGPIQIVSESGGRSSGRRLE
jgi:hypothetical protein